ncbi:DgyrCDS9136 [Dimorphilus gyrociliatus]|uniref:DgyrCDS9136 n=1 Tax=Dimorphilus gyrociliatus TaxID=2664684 RepID=A0A7I8VW61_9ANNE|nr:DgyrCDS9136 [Dimorphilus gyrociliatus]
MKGEPKVKRTKHDPVFIVKNSLQIKGLDADDSLIANLLTEYGDIRTVMNILTGADSQEIFDVNVEDTNGEDSDDDISSSLLYEEVLQIQKIMPKEPKKKIYKVLERFFDNRDRVQATIDHLVEHQSTEKEGRADNSEDLARLISMFPEVHEQTIKNTLLKYQHLEDYQEQCTIELSSIGDLSKMKQEEDRIAIDAPSTSKEEENVVDYRNEALIKFQEDVERLRRIFVDCDPNYIFEELENMADNPNRVEILSNRMFEEKKYPKLVDRLKREKVESRHNSLLNKNLDDMENFLRTFPDPKSTFRDEKATLSFNYKAHVESVIPNYFCWINIQTVNDVISKNGHSLVDIYQELEKIDIKYSRVANVNKFIVSNGLFNKEARSKLKLPQEVDEFFYNELLYAKNEEKILRYINMKNEEKEARRNAGKIAGNLNTCLCCYDDTVLEEYTYACNNNCKFCDDCVRRAGEHVLSAAEWKIDCMAGCGSEISLNSVQTVLRPSTVNALFVRMQQEEIKAAGLSDLVQCPFCDFAIILPDDGNKILNCLNPECLKSSCRKCRELEHTPLSCEEIEKADETRIRAMIELKMTEAMIRTCPSCKKRFFKDSGCNKMTCVCGQSMCYICKEAITGYDHFTTSGDCSKITDPNIIHEKEMEEALKKAKEEFEEENPGKDLTFKHNPEHLLNNMKDHQPQFHPFDNVNIVEDDDDSEDGDLL